MGRLIGAVMVVALAGLAGCGSSGPDLSLFEIGELHGVFRAHGSPVLYERADQFTYVLALYNIGHAEVAGTQPVEGPLAGLELDFDFTDLLLGSYRLQLLRREAGGGLVAEELWSSYLVALSWNDPVVSDWDQDYYLIGEGDGVVRYYHRLRGDPSRYPEIAEKYMYTCFRIVGDEEERLFRISPEWNELIAALPPPTGDGWWLTDADGDGEPDAIRDLPDVEIMLGVYVFDQPDAMGDDHHVVYEYPLPIRPDFGDEESEPVMLLMVFGTFPTGEVPAKGGASVSLVIRREL